MNCCYESNLVISNVKEINLTEEESCAFTLDKLVSLNTFKELSCNHSFTPEDINEWIKQSKPWKQFNVLFEKYHDSDCPVCRREVDPNFTVWMTPETIRNTYPDLPPSFNGTPIADEITTVNGKFRSYIAIKQEYQLIPKVKNIVSLFPVKAFCSFINACHWVTYGFSIALSESIKKIGMVAHFIFLVIGAIAVIPALPFLCCIGDSIFLIGVLFLLVGAIVRYILWNVGYLLAMNSPSHTPLSIWNNSLTNRRQISIQ